MKTYQINPRLQIVLLNLVPLLGVAFLDWSPFALFYAFWLETLAITFINATAILFAQKKEWSFYNLKRSVTFFFIQFGLLLFYLIFIIVFLGFQMNENAEQVQFFEYIFLIEPTYRWMLLGLFTFQLFEFLYFYFGKEQYKMSEPHDYFYVINSRTIVIHVVIVLGFLSYAFLKTYVSSTAGILAFTGIFVLVKIVLELATRPIKKQ